MDYVTRSVLREKAAGCGAPACCVAHSRHHQPQIFEAILSFVVALRCRGHELRRLMM
jgi:hypothetical protein